MTAASRSTTRSPSSAAEFPNVHVLDWGSIAAADATTILRGDGLHLTDQGRAVLASTVAGVMGKAPAEPGKCLATSFRNDAGRQRQRHRHAAAPAGRHADDGPSAHGDDRGRCGRHPRPSRPSRPRPSHRPRLRRRRHRRHRQHSRPRPRSVADGAAGDHTRREARRRRRRATVT